MVDRDTPGIPQVFLAGDTYSILITGAQTDGRYCLIDMHVPDGGGPPPHRHDLEEMFTVLHFVQVGDVLETRTDLPPPLDAEQSEERQRLALSLAPRYRTQMLL